MPWSLFNNVASWGTVEKNNELYFEAVYNLKKCVRLRGYFRNISKPALYFLNDLLDEHELDIFINKRKYSSFNR